MFNTMLEWLLCRGPILCERDDCGVEIKCCEDDFFAQVQCCVRDK